MEVGQSTDAIVVLKQLGLTSSAAVCYVHLLAKLPQPQSTAWLVEALPLKPASLYRALKELETKGFLHSTKSLIRGRRYYAEDLSRALDNYALYQRQLALPLIQQLHDR